MNKKEILKKFIIDNPNFRLIERKIKKRLFEIYEDIILLWPHSFQPRGFSERLYNYLNPEINPICKYNNIQSYSGFNSGYTSCKKYCKCWKEKQRDTWVKKYGCSDLNELNQKKLNEQGLSNVYQIPGVLEKSKQKCLDLYGYERPFQDKQRQEQIQSYWGNKNLNKQKSYIKSKEQIKDIKINATNERFGVEAGKILLDKDLFIKELKKYSRYELSKKLKCSLSLIDKKIIEWNLYDFSGRSSYYEQLIESFLKDNNIDYIKNTRKIINPKEIDYYIPDRKIGIEFNGLHWHGELLGKKDKNYHLNKLKLAEKNQIQLIQIFQDEWDNHSDIVKSILNNKLNLIKDKIFARKCNVKEISNIIAKKFLIDNHIQGHSVGCFLNIGLFYKDELVSVMTFKKNRKTIELSRFASKINISVIGGANKLFLYYIKKYNPTKIISYSDRRLFTGNVYQSLGFIFDKHTQPNYFYFIKANERIHRLNFTKQKLIKLGHDPNKTEWAIMQGLGYDRIWDCGHTKWIWSKI